MKVKHLFFAIVSILLVAGLGIFGFFKLNDSGFSPLSSEPKSVILYYDENGIMKEVAEKIQAKTNSDIIVISKDNTKNTSLNLDRYDFIFIGGQAKNHNLPMPVIQFLTNKELQGKIILPFISYDGKDDRDKRAIFTFSGVASKSDVRSTFIVRNTGDENTDVRLEYWFKDVKFPYTKK